MGYREELRAWLGAQAIPGRDAPFAELRAWNAVLFDAGFAAPAWPARFGGRDAGFDDQLAHHEEMARVGAPGPVNAIGVANIAPAIMRFGTEEQQERFLRPLLRGDEIWSQGMSEPGAGSDLASLRCAAVDDGDAFVVDGQKTWNSNGHFADRCQLYVRSDPSAPRKHQGITCLLVDLTTPGIEARPIRTMAGDESFAELFLTGVRVPKSAVLGAIGDGWAVATGTLSNERAGVASLYLNQQRALADLLARGGDRQGLAARYTEVKVLELLAKRTMAAAQPGPEGSVIKLAWSLSGQHLAEAGDDAHALLSSRQLTIAGGTTEVNKNIVAERVLGLPRDPS